MGHYKENINLQIHLTETILSSTKTFNVQQFFYSSGSVQTGV